MSSMKSGLLAVLLAVGVAGPALGQTPEKVADLMAQGKLDADLGHHEAAASAFAAVADSTGVPDAMRWEALTRLGVERREVGDYRESVKAFDQVWQRFGRDKDALRFLVLAVDGVIPGEDRWDAIWQQVALTADTKDPAQPRLKVMWPMAIRSTGRRTYSGDRIDVDLKDGDILPIFRLIADVTQLNIVVFPGLKGRATFQAKGVPWDEALDRILTPNGLGYRLEGHLVWVSREEDLRPPKSYSGKHLDVDFKEEEIREVFNFFERVSGLKIVGNADVQGRITLRLSDVPWDQAFEVVVRSNGLTESREGSTIRVARPHQR